jgi:hypothetical protein
MASCRSRFSALGLEFERAIAVENPVGVGTQSTTELASVTADGNATSAPSVNRGGTFPANPASAPFPVARSITVLDQRILGAPRRPPLQSGRANISNTIANRSQNIFNSSGWLNRHSGVSFSADLLNLCSSDYEWSMPLEDFCDRLEFSPFSSVSKIHRIIRRKEINGLRHEFLLLEAEILPHRVIWLRLERAAKRDHANDFTLVSFSSRFPSDDTARLAGNPTKLMQQESGIKAIVHFTHPKDVSLSILRLLLSALMKESKEYVLWQENCFFFCSAILEVLCQNFSHRIQGAYGNESLGTEVREKIRERFALVLSSSRIGSNPEATAL